MRISVIIAAVFLIGADDPVKKDMAQLEGDWSMVSADRDGTALPPDLVKSAKRVSKDGESSVTFGGQLFMKAKYTVDPAKKPKTIDYTLTEGPNKGKSQLGIYEIDGDTVKFCFAEPGAERPTDFASKQGSGRILSIWKREKK